MFNIEHSRHLINIIIVFGFEYTCSWISIFAEMTAWLRMSPVSRTWGRVTHWPQASNFKPLVDCRADGYSKLYYISIVLFSLNSWLVLWAKILVDFYTIIFFKEN